MVQSTTRRAAGAPHGVSRRAALTLKTIADPTRLKLLYTLSAAGAPMSSNDVGAALRISPPTVTHHMKKLLFAGFVIREQRGKFAYYRLDEDRFALLTNFLAEL